jgi:hypothetical protein
MKKKLERREAVESRVRKIEEPKESVERRYEEIEA